MSRDHHIEQLEERLNRLRIREVQAVESLQRLRTEEEEVAAALVVAQLRATRTNIHSPTRVPRTDPVTTPTTRYHIGERVEILNATGKITIRQHWYYHQDNQNWSSYHHRRRYHYTTRTSQHSSSLSPVNHE